MDDRWSEYFDANRRMWDERVPIHVGSRFYDVEGFRAGASTLRDFELEALGDDELTIERPYFQGQAPVRWDEAGTYADLEADTRFNVSYEWTQPVSRVIDALARRDLVLERFEEHDFTLFPRWPFLERHPGEIYRLPAGVPSLPLMYSAKFRAAVENGGCA